MCRITDYDHPHLLHHHHHHHRNHLKLTNFTVALTRSASAHLPEFLTLVILPRIAVSPIFLTLHPTFSTRTSPTTIEYASKVHVSFTDGTVFEVHHLGEELRLIKGVFREVECTCEVDDRLFAGVKLTRVEVRVGEDNARVLMKRRVSRTKGFKLGLVEIPEETEHDVDDTCDDDVDDDVESEVLELQGVKWAVDVGIWVGCLGLGLGLLVSTASVRSLKRRNLLLL